MNSPQSEQCRWHGYDNLEALQDAAVAAVLDSAARSIEERGRFLLVLAGGDTPREIYKRLSNAPTDWSLWHIYFSDERCMPPSDEELNSRMAGEAWLDHVPIPTAQIHEIPNRPRADIAADAYAQTLSSVGILDLTLLRAWKGWTHREPFPA